MGGYAAEENKINSAEFTLLGVISTDKSDRRLKTTVQKLAQCGFMAASNCPEGLQEYNYNTA